MPIGSSRTGKSHVATALGIPAIEHHRRKVRLFSTIELIHILEQEKAKGKAGQIAEGLTTLDPVIPDGLEYLAFSASSEALLFHSGRASPTSAPVCNHHQPQLQRMGQGLR